MIRPFLAQIPLGSPTVKTVGTHSLQPQPEWTPPSIKEVEQSAYAAAEWWQSLPLEWQLLTGAVGGSALALGTLWLGKKGVALFRHSLGKVSIAELERLSAANELPSPSHPKEPSPPSSQMIEPSVKARLKDWKVGKHKVDIYLDPTGTDNTFDHFIGFFIHDMFDDVILLGNGGEGGFPVAIKDIVTALAHDTDLTSKYVMSPNEETIRHKMIYDLPWSSQRIVIDMADPRFGSFLRTNYAPLNRALYKANTIRPRQAMEQAFSQLITHFHGAEHSDHDPCNQKRVRRIGDVIEFGPPKEAALVMQTICGWMGMESKLERGSPFLKSALWVRVKVDGVEMILDPTLRHPIVKGDSEVTDRFFSLYADDETNTPLDRHETPGGMGFSRGALTLLRSEYWDIKAHEVKVALIDARWMAAGSIVYRKDLLNWRRSQMEKHISLYISWAESNDQLSGPVSEEEIANEARLAVIGYSLLHPEDRKRLWAGKRPNGGLPVPFCELWLQRRRRGQAPFASLEFMPFPPISENLRSPVKEIPELQVEWAELPEGQTAQLQKEVAAAEGPSIEFAELSVQEVEKLIPEIKLWKEPEVPASPKTRLDEASAKRAASRGGPAPKTQIIPKTSQTQIIPKTLRTQIIPETPQTQKIPDVLPSTSEADVEEAPPSILPLVTSKQAQDDDPLDRPTLVPGEEYPKSVIDAPEDLTTDRPIAAPGVTRLRDIPDDVPVNVAEIRAVLLEEDEGELAHLLGHDDIIEFRNLRKRFGNALARSALKQTIAGKSYPTWRPLFAPLVARIIVAYMDTYGRQELSDTDKVFWRKRLKRKLEQTLPPEESGVVKNPAAQNPLAKTLQSWDNGTKKT